MNESEFNDINLNKDVWQGPSGDRYGADDQRAACWILAAALLHEGSHQDDCYLWPPQGNADKKAHHCAEIDGYEIELKLLCEAIDDPGLPSPGGVREVHNPQPRPANEEEGRKDKLKKLHMREFVEKDKVS